MNPKLNFMNNVNQRYFYWGVGGGVLFGTCIKKNQFDQKFIFLLPVQNNLFFI